MNRPWGPSADEAEFNRELRRRGIIFAAGDPNFNVEVQRRILTSGDLVPVPPGEAANWRKLRALETFSWAWDNPTPPWAWGRGVPVYAITVKYKGHEKCCCFWSKPFTLVRPHEPQWGTFPVDQRLTFARVCALMASRPELTLSDDPPCYISYGCVRGPALRIMSTTSPDHAFSSDDDHESAD